jgi:hypothetical protein
VTTGEAYVAMARVPNALCRPVDQA